MKFSAVVLHHSNIAKQPLIITGCCYGHYFTCDCYYQLSRGLELGNGHSLHRVNCTNAAAVFYMTFSYSHLNTCVVHVHINRISSGSETARKKQPNRCNVFLIAREFEFQNVLLYQRTTVSSFAIVLSSLLPFLFFAIFQVNQELCNYAEVISFRTQC